MGSKPILIRAPLASEDTSDGGSASKRDSKPVSDGEPDPILVASPTKDDDDDVGGSEDSFDEVDDDGFVVKVPILASNGEKDANPMPSVAAGVQIIDEIADSKLSPSLGEEGEAEDSSNDETEESFDEVDGDGFVVRYRNADSNPNRNSSFVTGVQIMDDNAVSNPKASFLEEEEAENSSNGETEDSFDEVDGDGFVVRARNINPNPNPSVMDEVGEVEEVFDEVDGDGFVIRDLNRILNINFNLNPSYDDEADKDGSFDDGILGQNRNLEDSAGSNPSPTSKVARDGTPSSVDEREGDDSSTNETEEKFDTVDENAEENFDVVDENGVFVKASVFADENSVANLNPALDDRVLGQDQNLDGNSNSKESYEDSEVEDFEGDVISTIGRVSSQDGIPWSDTGSDDKGEREDSDAQNTNLDDKFSAGESFEDSELFDRDNFARVSTRVGSSIYNPNSSSVDGGENDDEVLKQDANLNEISSASEYFDYSETEFSNGGGNFKVDRVFPNPSHVDAYDDDKLRDGAKSEMFKEILRENLNLDDGVESEVGNAIGESREDLDVLNEEDDILSGGAKEMSFLVEEDDLKPVIVNIDTVKMEKDGGKHDTNRREVEFNTVNAEQTDIASGMGENGVVAENLEVEDNVIEKDVFGRFPNGENPVEDEVLSGKWCLSEIPRMNVADGYASDVYMGRIEKENEDAGTLDEKYEILGSEAALMEAKPDTIEEVTDQSKETSKRKELETTAVEAREIGNAVSSSNRKYELEDQDGSAVVESGKSDNSASMLDGRNGGNGSWRVNLGLTYLAESNMVKKFVDNPNTDNERKLSPVEDEKLVIKLENASIELKVALNHSKPESIDHSNLFERNSKASGSGHEIDRSIVARGEEGEGKVSDKEGKILMDSISLSELSRVLASSANGRALASSNNSNKTLSTSDANGILPGSNPVGLGILISLRKLAQPWQSPAAVTSCNLPIVDKPDVTMTEEEKKFHEKVELIMVKFLRIVHRLGRSSKDDVATSVLYHLLFTEDEKHLKVNLQTVRKKAIELEREEKFKLDFSCNILIIGKSGVGKSATINSIFEEKKSSTNPFEAETTSVRMIEGVVNGIKIRVLDTPGLRPSLLDQASNRKVLSSVKKYMKKCPPDVVLYVDRMDTKTLDFNDLPLLRSITSTLGSTIWSNAIITLTHAAKALPEGSSGLSLSYEDCVNHRSQVVQQSIRHAAGDLSLMNSVILVENHPSCRRNREGQKVLPNGLEWRSELLLLCYCTKILSEVNSLLKVQGSSVQKLFQFRFRSQPMQFFLSSLLQTKAHPKLDNSDINLDIFSDEEDEEDEHNQFPQVHPLTNSQIAKLTKEHKKVYCDVYDYQLKLLQKKQFKQQIRRSKEIQTMQNNNLLEDFDDASTIIQSPGPDIELPPSFDSDNPIYLYRCLEQPSQFHTGFLVDSNGWDHDRSFDSVSLQKLIAIAKQFPAEVSLTLGKDKKDFSINLESSVYAKHGESASSLLSFDAQTIGNQIAYLFRGETKFKNLKKNKTTLGFSATFLGDITASGLKLEDNVLVGKRGKLSVSTGVVRAEGDVAYGANFEAALMKKDHHDSTGQPLATLGLSFFRNHGNGDYGGNLQSEVSVGMNSKMMISVGLNSKKSGQIMIRTCSSSQLQMMLVGLMPIVMSIMRKIWPGESST